MKKIELEEARSGADLILDTLLELGISTIFGYPGGAVLPLYDAIYKNDKINHILSLMSKEVCTKLKVMPNPLVNSVLLL